MTTQVIGWGVIQLYNYSEITSETPGLKVGNMAY